MASINTPEIVAGDLLLIEELAKHLKYSKTEIKFMKRLARKGIIAVEILLEEAISKVSKVKRSNKTGEDFVDGNDAKKAIVTERSHGTRGNSREASIGNLKNKKGNLLVAIAEPKSKQIFYFNIPPHEFSNQSAIMMQFNKHGGENTKFSGQHTQSWRMWNEYRMNSFRELCSKA